MNTSYTGKGKIPDLQQSWTDQSVYCVHSRDFIYKGKEAHSQTSSPYSSSPRAISDQPRNEKSVQRSILVSCLQSKTKHFLGKGNDGALIPILLFAFCFILAFYKAHVLHWFTFLIVLGKEQVNQWGLKEIKCLAWHHFCMLPNFLWRGENSICTLPDIVVTSHGGCEHLRCG